MYVYIYIYPLVIWQSHGKWSIYRWFSYKKLWFSMAMLNNQRVYIYIYIYVLLGNIDRLKILALGLNMDQASIIRPSHGCLPLKDQCVSFPASECGKPNAISIRSIVYPSHFSKMCRIQSCLAVADSAIPLQFQWGKWWLNTFGGTLFSVKAVWFST